MPGFRIERFLYSLCDVSDYCTLYVSLHKSFIYGKNK